MAVFQVRLGIEEKGGSMVRVTVYQNASGQYPKLRLEGHAGFAAYGDDIVCAAVSVLVINTVNSIEAFTEDVCEYSEQKDKDVVLFEVTSRPISDHAELLLKSLVFGLRSIAREYGKKYIQVEIMKMQEV